jgi:amidohydrolase
MDSGMRDRILARLKELHPALVERRRDLHRHPELAFQEHRTSKIVEDWLRGLGIPAADIRTGVAKTGVVARIRGRGNGLGTRRTIALRADMDGLPIEDAKAGKPEVGAYASTVPGRMHACGHDGHVTMALGAATVLSELKDELPGDVVMIFQPAEEGVGGAEPMIEEGVLDGVDFILGQHMLPLYPAGDVVVSEGPAMAAADFFTLRVRGTGGHGAYPHLAVDAIQIAAQIVTALQSIVARSVDPLQAAVVSIGTIHGGYNFNVIADVVEMKGTVRTFDATLRDAIPARIEALAKGVAESFGGKAELEYKRHYPATINHDVGVSLLREVAGEALGQEHVRVVAPSMGGEDFSYYLQKIPGCFYFVGCRAEAPLDPKYNLHHPAFDIDERVLSVGARVFVDGAMKYLAERS